MPEPVPEPLADYPIVVEVPVAWGDMDAFGHVNNTVFFRWFETARIAFLRAIDFTAGRSRYPRRCARRFGRSDPRGALE